MPVINTAQDLFDVQGMVIVITGGGSGLGLYAARALDANGAKAVYIIGRREKVLQDAAKTAVNGSIKPLVGDIGDKESLTKVVEQIRQEQGYINVLFANAGTMGPADNTALSTASSGQKPTIKEFKDALWQADMQDFTQTMHVNATAAYYTVLAFLDLLDAGNKKRNVPQDSQVIVTSSIAGLSRQLAFSFAYSASKAAAVHLVKMLSTSFAQHGFRIRVNQVAPGLYPSEMSASTVAQFDKHGGPAGHDNAFAGAFTMPTDRSPAERTGSEQDFAGLVLFLVSPAGAYLNGETMVSDGGRLAQLPAVY